MRKDESKEDAAEDNADEEMEEDAAALSVTHVSKILTSIFSNVEVYVNNQQNHITIGFYAHKYNIWSNFKGAISEYKGVLHCYDFDYE